MKPSLLEVVSSENTLNIEDNNTSLFFNLVDIISALFGQWFWTLEVESGGRDLTWGQVSRTEIHEEFRGHLLYSFAS